ncbi:MAG: TlpA family protein disulfide reductase [Bacteriovoracaceae bacterium]|jgi:thiol-disulfide isomerase/thioredoxin|nr:TlpA family protein disulfide reductase [Bacteriovoracaceae bacterium]
MRNRIFLILSVLIMTIGYIVYESIVLSNKFENFHSSTNSGTILEKMPQVKFQNFRNKSSYDFYKEDKNKRKLFLHFWATWCGPCEAEFPKLIKLMNSDISKNYHFVFVAVNDEPAKIEKFLRQFPKLTATIVLDTEFKHQKFFGVYRLPETFLFNSNGTIYRKYTGAKEWDAFEAL